MEIKNLPKNDIENALNLVWAVFKEFEAPDYCEQGINEFKDFISFDAISERIDRNEMTIWGCYNDGALVGVIATLGKNHLSLLFVHRDYHRLGIARHLFQTVLDACKQDGRIKTISVNSSPYATGFYHSIGFEDTDTEKTVNGIRFTPMVFIINLGDSE